MIHQVFKIPHSCSAVGCSDHRSKESALKFYGMRFGSHDKSLDLRKKWVAAIKWDKLIVKEIDKATICSTNFLSSKVCYFYVRYI